MKSTVERTNEKEVLKILSEQAPVGVCIMEDGKFRYFNSNFPVATGYTADELIGKDSLEIVAPEDREMVRENTIKMLKGERLSPYQFRVIHKDGGIVWIMATVKSIQYHGRWAVLGNYMEVTERKQMEEALKENEERYRELANSITDVFFAMDEHLKYTYWNKASEILTGIQAVDAIGKSLSEIFLDTPGVRKAEKVYRKVLRTQQPQIFVSDYDTDGRHYIFEISAYPSRSGISVFAKDVTKDKQAEEALRQSEEKYRALFDSSGIGMFVMDAETRKIVVCNQVAVKMFGFSSVEEAIGINPLDFVLPEDKEKALEITVKEMFEQDLRRTHEYRVVNKDGREGWVSVTGVKIMHEGRLAGLVSITDITERKQTVETLRQSEERFRTILEEMEDSYFEVDLGGHFTFVNNATCRSLGYSDKELIGMSYKEITLENDIEPVFQIFNEVYRTGKPSKGYLWTIVRKDGTHRLVEHSAFPLGNDKGEIIGFRGVGRDITKRKQAEEKLRQSEENYKTLFNSSVIGMYVLDIETLQVVMGNRAAAEMIGFGFPEEGIGVNPFDFVVPEDRERVLAIAINDFLQDSRRTHEIEVMDKNGRRGWQSFSIARIMHEGRAASLVSFVDITERKRAEEALGQSEEKYRTILEEMEDAYFEVDLGGHFTFVNNSVCRDLGYSRKELIGMSYKDYTVEDDIDSVFRVFNEVYQTGVPNKGFPWKTIRKDESYGFAETSVALLRDDKSEIIGFRGVGRDITERKRAEEALRQSEENYRALFDSMVICTFVLDAETMKVVMGNQAAAEMFGFSSAEEAIGINPFDFIPPEDRERVLESAGKELFEQDLRRTHEARAVTKDGREIWISVTGARIMHGGRLAGLISFTDITEQKQQNERLMMADRLASIGELAAGAAHELNNPLTSILGFSQLLMEMDIPDDIREDLTLINSEAQRAANVTKNLLTFARKHAPVKQLNQINNIIEDVLKLRAYEHKINSIKVERQLAPGLPEIMVDYFQIQQVLLNVIINAEYFMTEAHNRGTLTITTKKQNGTVRISIADDGPGIPSEKLSRIFDPFFTTKEAGKGTGLGLSICHGIVTEHGGQIYARNQRGKGATIVVELPINGH